VQLPTLAAYRDTAFQTGGQEVIPLDLNGIIAFDAGSARGAQHCIEESMLSSGNGPDDSNTASREKGLGPRTK
jgi:hypothetical protein